MRRIWQLYVREVRARRKQGVGVFESIATPAWGILHAEWMGWEWVGAQGGLTWNPQEKGDRRWE